MLTAVVVRTAREPELAATLDRINDVLGRTPNVELHWHKNIKRHDERKFVASELAKLPATFIVAVLDKSSLRGKVPGLQDQGQAYRYLLRRLLERVSWYLTKQAGVASVRLAHVRGMKYDMLHSYLDLLRSLPNCNIDWDSFSARYPSFDQPSRLRALQVPDLVSGAAYAAFNPDRFGTYEAAYLTAIAPRFWVGPTKKLHTYGLHLVGTNSCHLNYPWWNTICVAAGC
jgi:hypothetical protein